MFTRSLFAPVLTGIAALTLAGTAMAGETRSYVVNMFHVATAHVGANCPDGLNPLSDEIFKHELRRLGYPSREIETLMKDFPNGAYIPITTNRGRVNGQAVNVYANPWTQPDPKLNTVKGTTGFGFNLDGKVSPGDFIDPETKEKGVDNQLWRAVGCIQNFAAMPPDKPIYAFGQWDLTRDSAPAWLIQISGIDNPVNDDDVTVMIDKSVDIISRDGSGEVMRDTTFRLDPNSRSRNVVRGRIKDGMLTTDVWDMYMVTDPKLLPYLDLRQARLRFKLNEDGSLTGVVGGYYDWWPFYWTFAQGGWVIEHATGIDVPGLYYALKKMADANPDPKTGENRSISTAYSIEAFPAVISSPGTKELADAGQ
ncbi:MAG: hypothetical protein K2P94_04055 [Rhodospirillaceae bacterium]|nr:hypothetical protein [Rhodospirillaceae bacterium]